MRRKKLAGSYFRLRVAKRAYFCSPYAARTRSGSLTGPRFSVHYEWESVDTSRRQGSARGGRIGGRGETRRLAMRGRRRGAERRSREA